MPVGRACPARSGERWGDDWLCCSIMRSGVASRLAVAAAWRSLRSRERSDSGRESGVRLRLEAAQEQSLAFSRLVAGLVGWLCHR